MPFFTSMARTCASEEVKNTAAWPCCKSYGSTTRTTIFTWKQDRKITRGTYQQKYTPNKQMPIYACPAAGNRCHVGVLDMYYSKVPEQAFENDVFYLKPSGCPGSSILQWAEMNLARWSRTCVWMLMWLATKQTTACELLEPLFYSMQRSLKN